MSQVSTQQILLIIIIKFNNKYLLSTYGELDSAKTLERRGGKRLMLFVGKI